MRELLSIYLDVPDQCSGLKVPHLDSLPVVFSNTQDEWKGKNGSMGTNTAAWQGGGVFRILKVHDSDGVFVCDNQTFTISSKGVHREVEHGGKHCRRDEGVLNPHLPFSG